MSQLLAILQMQEYWRYLLTGIPTVLLLGLFCRLLGRLIMPFAEWVSFTGECLSATITEQGVCLQIQFADRNRLNHTVVFLSDHPTAADIQPGTPVKIALRTKAFAAGEYPDSTPEPIQARNVYLAVEKNTLLRHQLFKEVCIGFLSCAFAFALFYLAMQVFF